MRLKLNGRLGLLKKFSTLLLLLILHNHAFAQNLEIDTLIGDYIQVPIQQYKQDNIMINTLMNDLEECQEIDAINKKIEIIALFGDI